MEYSISFYVLWIFITLLAFFSLMFIATLLSEICKEIYKRFKKYKEK